MINLDDLNNIPDSSTKLFIDVGTSIDAPNAASWLKEHSDCFVIGVEPNPENIDVLRKGRNGNVSFPYLALDKNAVIQHNNTVAEINDRFCIFECAIDNVEEPTTTSFYMTDDRNSGCSSLLMPTEKLGLDVKKVHQVDVVPLQMILKKLIPSRFEYVTFLKTDAQGKDIDVVKSCKDYLNKIFVLQMEVNTVGQYENEQNLEEIEQFMFSNNFTTLGGNFYDRIYVNKELASKMPTPSIKFIET